MHSWNKYKKTWECWYRVCTTDIKIRMPDTPTVNLIPPLVIDIPDLEQGIFDCNGDIVPISYRSDPEGRAFLKAKGTDPDDYDETTGKMGCIPKQLPPEKLTDIQKYKIKMVHTLFNSFPDKYITHARKNYLQFWPSRLFKVYDHYTIFNKRQSMKSYFYYYYIGYLRWNIQEMNYQWPIFRARDIKHNVKPPNDFPMRKLYVRYWEYLEGNLPDI